MAPVMMGRGYNGGPGHPTGPTTGARDERCATRRVGGLRGEGGEVVQGAMGRGQCAEAEAAAEAEAEGEAIIPWVVIV